MGKGVTQSDDIVSAWTVFVHFCFGVLAKRDGHECQLKSFSFSTTASDESFSGIDERPVSRRSAFLKTKKCRYYPEAPLGKFGIWCWKADCRCIGVPLVLQTESGGALLSAERKGETF